MQHQVLDTLCDSKPSPLQIENWKSDALTQGYWFAKLQIDSVTETKQFHFLWTRGPLYVLEDLKVLNPIRTQIPTLKRFLNLDVGQGANYFWLQSLAQRLKALEFMTLDTMYFARRENRHSMLMVMGIREWPTQALELHLSGAQKEFKGTLDMSFDNLGGTLRAFQFHFANEKLGRELSFKYREPWIFDWKVGAQIEGEWLQQDTLSQSIKSTLSLGQWWAQPWAYKIYSSWLGQALENDAQWQGYWSYGSELQYQVPHWRLSTLGEVLNRKGPSSARMQSQVQYRQGQRMVYSLGSRWGFMRQVPVDLELWKFKLIPALDYRGWRFPVYLSNFALVNGEWGYAWDALQLGVFADGISPEFNGDVQWVLGPQLKFQSAQKNHQLQLSVAVNSQHWQESLVHLNYSHRF